MNDYQVFRLRDVFKNVICYFNSSSFNWIIKIYGCYLLHPDSIQCMHMIFTDVDFLFKKKYWFRNENVVQTSHSKFRVPGWVDKLLYSNMNVKLTRLGSFVTDRRNITWSITLAFIVFRVKLFYKLWNNQK